MIEGSGSGSSSIPLTIEDTDPDQGGPKTFGSGGSGSATLIETIRSLLTQKSLGCTCLKSSEEPIINFFVLEIHEYEPIQIQFAGQI